MRTSATGSNRATARVAGGAYPAGGFTYIELLVVVFLLGLLVSLALLSLQGETPAERLEREARRLYARMDLAREESVLQGRTLGLRIDGTGYRFLELRQDRWQALADDRLLPRHELPETTTIALDLDGIEVSLDTDEDSRDDERPPPQIYFLASGEIQPDFRLQLVSGDTDAEFVIAPGEEEWLTLAEAGNE